jgi:hypothetical protein
MQTKYNDKISILSRKRAGDFLFCALKKEPSFDEGRLGRINFFGIFHFNKLFGDKPVFFVEFTGDLFVRLRGGVGVSIYRFCSTAGAHEFRDQSAVKLFIGQFSLLERRN